MSELPITFKNLAKAGEPEPGELWIQPGPKYVDSRALAGLAIDVGADAMRGAGDEATTIVVSHNPSFDDVLAATILQRRLTGRPVQQFLHFAKYAERVRQGHRPSKAADDELIEGIFLLLRNNAGEFLDKPGAGPKFLADWARMMKHIDAAADAEISPFETSPFANCNEFAAERSELRDDKDKYGHDVDAGKRFTARIPGKRPRNCGALLLQNPKSELFKYWAREDPNAPGGNGHLLMMVNWGKEWGWVITTNPNANVSLLPLRDRLQKAEERTRKTARHRLLSLFYRSPAVNEHSEQKAIPRQGTGDSKQEWKCGRDFGYTLIAEPDGGTKLTENAVLKVVKKWCRLRPFVRPAGPRPEDDFHKLAIAKLTRSAAVTLILLVLAVAVPWMKNSVLDAYVLPVQQAVRDLPGQTYRNVTVKTGDPLPRIENGKSQLYVLSIGVSDYQHVGELKCATPDAKSMSVELESHGAALFGRGRVHCTELVDTNVTEEKITDAFTDLKGKAQPTDLVIVFLAGHGSDFDQKDGEYRFLLPGANPEKNRLGHLLPWSFLRAELRELNCRVFVVVDTCHAASIDLRDVTFGKSVQNVLDSLSVPGKGMGVLAACRRYEKAAESKTIWGHGALTLAILEFLTGEDMSGGRAPPDLTMLPKGQDINVKALHAYVEKRVEKLSPKQHVEFKKTDDFFPESVPIGRR